MNLLFLPCPASLSLSGTLNLLGLSRSYTLSLRISKKETLMLRSEWSGSEEPKMASMARGMTPRFSKEPVICGNIGFKSYAPIGRKKPHLLVRSHGVGLARAGLPVGQHRHVPPLLQAVLHQGPHAQVIQ